MAGTKGSSGRQRSSGKVYEFHFYYRFDPRKDPPELEALLEAIVQANGQDRQNILRAALLGGSRQAQAVTLEAGQTEDTAGLNDMLAGF
jgi:hypothetical protein